MSCRVGGRNYSELLAVDGRTDDLPAWNDCPSLSLRELEVDVAYILSLQKQIGIKADIVGLQRARNGWSAVSNTTDTAELMPGGQTAVSSGKGQQQ